MPHPFALPAVGGLSILGAAFGVWLGKSAVAEIDPIYYNEPETRFHADLAPYRSPDWAQIQATEYQQAGRVDGYGSFCLGCIEHPEEYVPAPRREPEAIEDGWTASAAYAEEEAQPAMVVATVRDPEWERVERYAAYPVTANQRIDEETARVEQNRGEDGERQVDGL